MLAYLLLGSNLGERSEILFQACEKISRTVGKIVTYSSVYETEPWGNHQQPWFYNQALTVDTSLSAFEIISAAMEIEKSCGRERQERWGPRMLDIDLLMYGQEIYQTDELTLPHPRLPHRKFTLVPLAEIAPQLVHPVLRITVEEMLQACTDRLTVRKVFTPAYPSVL
jgi:2-amino-4-hydroxy-6-hydroxymethyldihydropteridine diphosphokinase